MLERKQYSATKEEMATMLGIKGELQSVCLASKVDKDGKSIHFFQITADIETK